MTAFSACACSVVCIFQFLPLEDVMNSKFTGGLFWLIVINIAQGLIVALTLGIGTPWAVCLKESWLAEHTIIDGHRLTFDGKGSQLFGNYIVWFLLGIVTLGIYFLWLSIKMKQWVTKHTHMI